MRRCKVPTFRSAPRFASADRSRLIVPGVCRSTAKYRRVVEETPENKARRAHGLCATGGESRYNAHEPCFRRVTRRRS
jgi:Ni,Fe-hydrogenase III small subunit